MNQKCNNVEFYYNKIVDVLQTIDISKVTLLTGPNGCGKSMIRKQMAHVIMKAKNKTIKQVFIPHASMEFRSCSNIDAIGMNHDLNWLGTGDTTISSVKSILNYGVIENTKEPDYVVLDEPELGLGEELQLGLCDLINEKTKNKKCGVLIICHSKIMVQHLNFDNWINLDNMTYDEWVNRIPKKISIDEFKEFSTNMFKLMQTKLG